MTTMSALPRSRPLTYADLEAMPDDGHRYELLDGVLLVSPAPRPRHQQAVLRLAIILDQETPPDMQTYVAPLDVVLADDTALQPDVLVAYRSDLTERNLPAAPVLAIEVLSPSTRLFDLWTKRERYARAGTAAYWVVDPDEPSLTAWELRDGTYEQVAHVIGDEPFDASVPFAVRVTPSSLVSTR